MERSRLRQGNEVPKQWRVAEQESVPKAGRERSEDGFLPGPDCFAVLDGVSSGDSPERIEGLTPGQFAVHIGIEALQAAAQLDTKEEVVSFISARLKEAVRRYELITIPSFVFVAFFPKWNTIIRVGDSLYKMRHRDGEWKGHNPGHKVDADKEVVRQELLKRERGRGATEEELLAHDPTRHRMRRITREWQPQFRNKPDAGEREDMASSRASKSFTSNTSPWGMIYQTSFLQRTGITLKRLKEHLRRAKWHSVN